MPAFPAMKPVRLLALSALACLAPGLSAAQDAGAPEALELAVRGAAIRAETAASPEELRRGLMGRRSLCENCGMLFLFPRPAGWCMWMRGTLIPLSVAFISGRGEVIALEEMEPGSDALHCSPAPAAYGLEADPGWFRRNEIGPGDRVSGLPDPRL